MKYRLLWFLLILAGCQTTPPAPVTLPPVAKKIPHVTTIHGDRLVDNYYWLRQRNSPAVLAYLKAENAYTTWFMRPTLPLQEALYKEMLGHIQETDTSVSYRDGDWLYYIRTHADSQYPIYCRRRPIPGATEEITLDLNQLGAGKQFIDLGVYDVSDDGNLLAYTLDLTGFQEFTLYVKDLRTGEVLSEKIPHVTDAVWAADNHTLFYVAEDDAKRAYRLWRHELGSQHDTLVYEEKDARFDLGVGRSRSQQFIFAESASKTTTEARYLRADHPTGEWKILAPREEGHEYDVDHAGDRFYIRTNDKGPNFRLVTAPVSNPSRQNWTELVPARDDVVLEDVTLFAQHYVLQERAHGLPQLRVIELATGQEQRIEIPEPSYALAAEENEVFNTNVFRYGFESLRTPRSILDFNMTTGQSALLKRFPVKNYDSNNYEAERLFATASDGTKIPISIVYRKDVPRAGLLLDGYGAYGMSEDVWFSSQRLVLLDRGIAFAIAHVRGGGEFGRKWYDAGRLLNKRNTFTDFIACADFLVRKGYTTRDKLAITGASAGGLLMGAVLNLRPDLCHVALVEVPFVDVINTMLDESLPLTIGEFEEWGNPKDRQFYEYMKSYSPYDNIAATNYPAMLVRSSLNDSRVMYWEPAKYVAKLRATNSSPPAESDETPRGQGGKGDGSGRQTDHNPLLFQIDLEPAGHSGKSGRYDELRDMAFDYAFLLRELGTDR
jgi:oligopeptidase B